MAIWPGLSVCCVGEVFASFIGAAPFIVVFLSGFSFTMNCYGSCNQLLLCHRIMCDTSPYHVWCMGVVLHLHIYVRRLGNALTST